MIARNDDDDRVGECTHETGHLPERMQDRGICGADLVKHVAGDDHEVGRERDRAIGRARERGSDVSLPLVHADGSLTLVLPVSEVQVCEVDEAHAGGLSPVVSGEGRP